MNQSPHHDAELRSTGYPGPAGGQGMNQAMQVLSYLIAGIVAYGLLGWLGDHLLHTSFLMPIGIVVGAALGVYLVISRFAAEPVIRAEVEPRRTTTKTRG